MRGEPMCGGRDYYIDKKAPNEIRSEQMTFFCAESALPAFFAPRESALSYIYAFAAPAGEGTFCFFASRGSFGKETSCALAWIKENMFPKLTALTKELHFVQKNGVHSKTHGLPENFGGSVRIEYASGEYIHFEDNQRPVFGTEAGERIKKLFRDAMNGEQVSVPSEKEIRAVRFSEERTDGGFSRACLTQTPEGKFVLTRQSKYGDSAVYTSEKEVPRERMERYRDIVRGNLMFAFPYLPKNSVKARAAVKTLTFVLADGREIVVPNDRLLPEQMQDAFFQIELDLA